MPVGPDLTTLVDEVGFESESHLAVPFRPSASEGTEAGHHHIYTHGCTARVRFPGASREQVLEAWEALGYPVDDPDHWCVIRRSDAVERYRMTGSASLTGQAPGRTAKTRNSSLVELRRSQKLGLYCLDLDLTGSGGPSLGIQSVRQTDIGELVGRLGLPHEICHYTRIERYVVLPPAEAHRLAEAFDKPFHQGRGKNSPKQFAIEGLPLSLLLPDGRARQVALKAYRITRGATASFRLEATLGGPKAKGNVYQADAFAALDNVLVDFLELHRLRTIPKPARWEPLEPSRVKSSPTDRLLTGVRSTGWRGKAIRPAEKHTVARLHTPHGASAGIDLDEVADFPDGQDGSGGSSCISVDYTPEAEPEAPQSSQDREEANEENLIPMMDPMLFESMNHEDESVSFTDEELRFERATQEDEAVETFEVRESSSRNCPYETCLREIQTFGQGLHEIVLDFEHDPKDVLAAIKKTFGDSVGFGALSLRSQGTGMPDTWRSVAIAEVDQPIRDDRSVNVIVVDPNYVSYWHEAFSDSRLRPGPYVAKGWSANLLNGDVSDRYWDVLGTALWDDLEQLREVTERPGGGIVILVTVDARPFHGTGPWRKSHLYTDARLRSILGRAGTRFCHQRYFIESAMVPVRKVGGGPIRQSERREIRRVICWKDEIEGLVGRCTYVDGSVELGMPLGRSQHARVTYRRTSYRDSRPWFPTKKPRNEYDRGRDDGAVYTTVGLG